MICGSPVCVSGALTGGPSNYLRWTYSRCSACGFLFLNPVCSEEQLQIFYAREYNPPGQVFNSFRDCPSFRRFEAWLRLRKILKELGDASKGSRWLEVGCGYGSFLEVCKEKGIDIIGQDLSEEALRTCRTRGLGIVNALSDGTPNGFDVVFSAHTLEHIPRGSTFLARIYDCMQPKGQLILVTPNGASLNSFLHRRRWRWWCLPDHCSLYTPVSIRIILECAGFSDIRVFTTETELELNTLWQLCFAKVFRRFTRTRQATESVQNWGGAVCSLIGFPVTRLLARLRRANELLVFATRPQG